MAVASRALVLGFRSLAAPHIPADDNAILARVPAAESTHALQPLRQQVALHPEDLEASLALTRGYLKIGRANADPRFVSYAQATLTPWMTRPHPGAAVLTLQASTLQYLHRFDDALVLLDQALTTEPANGQAWLIKAAILQVQGRFPEARQACRPLARTAGQLIALTCLSSVDSLTGRLNCAGALAKHCLWRSATGRCRRNRRTCASTQRAPPPCFCCVWRAIGRVRVIGTAIDITARKRTEEQLRDSDRQKDEFLAMLAPRAPKPTFPYRHCE